jgi:hypothetical protein
MVCKNYMRSGDLKAQESGAKRLLGIVCEPISLPLGFKISSKYNGL